MDLSLVALNVSFLTFLFVFLPLGLGGLTAAIWKTPGSVRNSGIVVLVVLSFTALVFLLMRGLVWLVNALDVFRPPETSERSSSIAEIMSPAVPVFGTHWWVFVLTALVLCVGSTAAVTRHKL